jgi:hypothetical protein
MRVCCVIVSVHVNTQNAHTAHITNNNARSTHPMRVMCAVPSSIDRDTPKSQIFGTLALVNRQLPG